MTRTSRTLIRSFTRVRSSRRGLLSKAIRASYKHFAAPLHLASIASSHERLEGLRAQIAAGSAPYRDGGLGGLAVAGHQHVRDFLQLGFADLISNLLLPLVELHPEAGRRQPVAHGPRVLIMAIGNGQDHHLYRRQPERERPGVVLDQQRDEPLETAENRPVNDDRLMFGVVGPDVLQAEALRNLVVELDRRALPPPADGVGDVEIDLRAVEVAAARVERIRLLGLVERQPELSLGMIPRRVFAQPVAGTRRQLGWNVVRGRCRRAEPGAAAGRPLRRSDLR